MTFFQENSSDKVPITHTFSIDPGHLNDSPNFISLVNKLTENITYINNSLNSEIQLMKEDHLRDHVSNFLILFYASLKQVFRVGHRSS